MKIWAAFGNAKQTHQVSQASSYSNHISGSEGVILTEVIVIEEKIDREGIFQH
jgi:hypothetical protein